MDKNYFKTVILYIDSLTKKNDANIDKLKCIIKGCPLIFQIAVLDNKTVLEYDSKIASKNIINCRSITSLSLGICYFLAKSNWKLADELIPALITFINSKIKPSQTPVYFFKNNQNDQESIINEMLWCNFSIIPATLFSYANTLQPTDSLFISITKSVYSLWIRVAKRIIKYFTKNGIGINSKTTETTTNNLEISSYSPFWDIMLFTSLCNGINLTLSSQNLTEYILNPDKLPEFNKKSLLFNCNIPDGILRYMFEFVNDDRYSYVGTVQFNIKKNPFKHPELVSVKSALLQGISSLTYRIGKSSNLKNDSSLLRKFLPIINKLYEIYMGHSSTFNAYNNPLVKVTDLKSLLGCENKFLTAAEKCYKSSLFELIELKISFIDNGDYQLLEKLTNQFFYQFNSSDRCKWPIPLGEIFLKESSIYGISKIIEKFPNEIEKLRIISNLAATLTKPAEFFNVIGSNCDSQIYKSYQNLIGAFSFKYSNNEESIRDIPSIFAYYFYFKQKFIHSILECLKSAITIQSKNYPDSVLESMSHFSLVLLDWKYPELNDSNLTSEISSYVKLSLSLQALGYIGVEFSHKDGVYDSIVSMMQQKFMVPPSVIDLHIVTQLINLMLSVNTIKNYPGIMDIFKKVITSNTCEIGPNETENDIALKYPCQTIVNLLLVISTWISGEEVMLRYMQDLIDIYIQSCITLRKFQKQTLRAQYLITFMSEFIKSISCIMERIGPIVSNNSKLQQLFKNFWVYLVLMGSTNSGPFSSDLITHYRKISKYSPPLVVDHLRSDLQYNVTIKDESFDTLELSETRKLLIDCLECNQLEIKNIIQRLPALHVIFLLAIFEQENLAVEYDSSRFPHLFLYLEDKALGQDKQNIGTLIEYTCDKIFTKFVDNLMEIPHGTALDNSLTNHIKLLLVKFNSEIKRVQRSADKYLSILINKFPHMLWNSNVVLMMLDFVHLLKITCIQMGTQCESCIIDVPRMKMKFIIPDTKEKRDRLIIDYQSRCESFINEAAKWAPTVICSILLDYMVDKRMSFKDMSIHYGIELLTSSIISVEAESNVVSSQDTEDPQTRNSLTTENKPDINNYSNSGGIKTRPKTKEELKSSYFSTSRGFVSICTFTATLRSHYIGKIEGMLESGRKSSLSSNERYDEFETELLQKLWNTKNMSDSEISDAVLLATSFICTKKRFNRKIIHLLCSLPVNMMVTEYMKLSIECWEWILTSCREHQLSLLYNIWSTWESTIYKSVGLFNFNPSKSDRNNPEAGQSAVHDMWIKFLIQRFDVIKFYHYEQVKVISLITVESIKFILSKEITLEYLEANSVCLLRLLCLGLKLIQNTYLSNLLSQSIIRENVFFAILAYFSTIPMWPRFKITPELIDLLSQLRKLLMGDRKSNSNTENGDLTSFNSIETSRNSLKGQSYNKYNTTQKPGSKSFLTIGTRRDKNHNRTISKTESSMGLEGASQTTHVSCAFSIDSQSSLYSFKITSLKNEEIDILRNILIYLIVKEISRLSTWLNPTDKNEGLGQYSKSMKNFFSDKTGHKKLKLLWRMNPKAAIFLSQRALDTPSLTTDIGIFLRSYPSYLIDEPLAASSYWSAVHDYSNTSNHWKSLLIFWKPSSIVKAFEYISRHICTQSVPATQYSVFCIKSSNLDDILFYTPQLVQSLRNDTWGYLEEYVLWISQRTKLISHQFLWNMQTNIFLDEDCTQIDPNIGQKLTSIIELIKKKYDRAGLSFYNREFSFFGKITNISAILKPIEKSKRKPICQQELAKISPEIGVYLPTNPDSLIIDIDYSSGIPMQSAAKAPFLARFHVYQATTKMIEEINASDNMKIPDLCNGSDNLCTKGAIFKVGDDVRQDVLALQIISIFKTVFDKLGLKLYLFPYRVVSTAPGCGVIECVPNAKSRDQLGKHTDASLHQYFLNTFGGEGSDAYKKARENFANSLSAYSIVTYILQVKDRHNGNIMINSEGFLIHIDFGFLFESSPGGNIGFEPDMKITAEMLKILGGSIDAPYFKSFVQKSIQGFLAIRPYCDEIINVISLMLDTGLPCFRGDTLKRLRYRFCMNLSEKEAAQIFEKLIYDSCLNYRTRLYDLLQLAQNEIPC